MNAIQIQDLINKIGKFNDIDIQDYFENGREIFEQESAKIEELNNELNQKLLVQLKEKSDVELLQTFLNVIEENGGALEELYHKYRIKLAESNNTNPIFSKSIPIVCNLIDVKLDYLSDLKKELQSKIDFFDYRINTDFQFSSNPTSEANQNQEYGNSGRATFNLSKKESLMLLYVLEQNRIIRFDDNSHRRNFIEQNFNFTEVRNNSDYGKSFPMTGTNSEFSKFRSDDKYEISSNNKTLKSLFIKLQDIVDSFEFVKSGIK